MSDFVYHPENHTGYFGERQGISVTQVIDANGLIPPQAKQPWYAERGKLIHLAAKYFWLNTLDYSSLDPRIVPFIESLDKWVYAARFRAKDTETLKWLEEYLLFGTRDVTGLLSPDDLLLDLKSGAHGPACQFQTAGYDLLDPAPRRKRGCLHLNEFGKQAIFYPHRDRTDRQQFLICLAKAREGMDG